MLNLPELDGTIDPDSLTVVELVLAAVILVVAGLVEPVPPQSSSRLSQPARWS